MGRVLPVGALIALVAGPALAADPLVGPLRPLAFMVGDWRAVGDSTGAGAGGDSSIQPDLQGRILIRRDHVLTAAGAAFDIYMPIYADGDRVKAELIDTEGHTIHYAVTPGPGPSAVFESPAAGAAPGFRLTYAVSGFGRLHIRFEIAPPGGVYKTYTEGDVARR